MPRLTRSRTPPAPNGLDVPGGQGRTWRDPLGHQPARRDETPQPAAHAVGIRASQRTRRHHHGWRPPADRDAHRQQRRRRPPRATRRRASARTPPARIARAPASPRAGSGCAGSSTIGVRSRPRETARRAPRDSGAGRRGGSRAAAARTAAPRPDTAEPAQCRRRAAAAASTVSAWSSTCVPVATTCAPSRRARVLEALVAQRRARPLQSTVTLAARARAAHRRGPTRSASREPRRQGAQNASSASDSAPRRP